MLSSCATGVLTFFNFVVSTPLVIAASLIIGLLLIAGPLFLVQAFLVVRSAPVCVLAGISGLACRAWLSLWTRWSLRWGCGAPSNK